MNRKSKLTEFLAVKDFMQFGARVFKFFVFFRFRVFVIVFFRKGHGI
jgi:hypothetical protein